MSKLSLFSLKQNRFAPVSEMAGPAAPSNHRHISLEIGVYLLAAFFPLGATVLATPQCYVLPFFIVLNVALLSALETGGSRLMARTPFWVGLALAVLLALILPLLIWPDYPMSRLFSELGADILFAAVVAMLLSLISHALRKGVFRIQAGGPAAFILHGAGVFLGGFLIELRFLTFEQMFRPGGMLSARLETPLVLVGGALTVAAVSLVLLHVLSEERRHDGPLARRARPIWVVALAALTLFVSQAQYSGEGYVALLLALPLLCLLPFAPRSPILTSACLALGIALLPNLPVVLGFAHAPEPAPVVRLAPLVGAVLVIVLVLALRRASQTRVLFEQTQRLDRLRRLFAENGAGEILCADPKRKRILSPVASPETHPEMSFADFFRDAPSHEMLTLLEAFGSDTEVDAHRAFPVHLHGAAGTPGKLETSPRHRIDLYILEKTPDVIWLGRIDRSECEEYELRAERAEKALAEALLREERLLTVASHELRTPMSVLSMLSEELDEGTPWEEVAPGFKSACDRVNVLLDDLRVRDSTKEAQMLQTVFTLREMSMHLQEVFTGPAQANGVALLFSLSQRSDTPLRSDYGRVFIALSKLIHNAIVHARATEISISAFLTVQSDGVAIVTWQVSDNGRGIPSERRQTIFRPFDTDGKGPSNRPGLGLYTARKAIEAMGGEVNLRRPDDIGGVPRRLPPFSTAKDVAAETPEAEAALGMNPGASFVLKHPARLAEHVEYTTLEHLPVTESQASYPDKTVLLVEDNQIVGDIMVVRLRRLFGTTIWAERGDEALLAYEKNQPDLLLVDQLLPGKLGSEVVQYVRETNREVPIVGITASAMGSECAELEAAGANYALEKPLSMQQMKKIAQEFFGAPEAQ